MYVLLIVALVLAWPTYGLSILAWFVLRFIRLSRRVAAQEKQRGPLDRIHVPGALRQVLPALGSADSL